MSFLEIAQKRYATKTYRNEKISEAKIKELAEILRLSPQLTVSHGNLLS